MTVCVFVYFLTKPCCVLQCIIVAFPDHTYLFLYQKTLSQFLCMVANKFQIDAKPIISLSAGEIYRYQSQQYGTRSELTIRPDLNPNILVPAGFPVCVLKV